MKNPIDDIAAMVSLLEKREIKMINETISSGRKDKDTIDSELEEIKNQKYFIFLLLEGWTIKETYNEFFVFENRAAIESRFKKGTENRFSGSVSCIDTYRKEVRMC